MEKQIDVLEYWEEEISVFPKLDITDAKTLYNEFLNESDADKKHEIFNTLICGTLYVVFNYVKKNKLDIIKTPKYDIGDIINTCNELWINAINEGGLVSASSFSDILDYSFSTKLTSDLNETDFTVSELTVLNTKTFYIVLYEFIEEYKKNGSVSFEEFKDLVEKCLDVKDLYEKCLGLHGYVYDNYDYLAMNAFGLSNNDAFTQTYELMLNIVESLKDENDDVRVLNKLKIDKFKYLLLEAGLQGFRVDIDNVYHTGFEDSFVDYYTRRKAMDLIFSCSELDDRKKDIIAMEFGVNGSDRYSRAKIAEKYSISIMRLEQLERKAFYQLRRKPEIMEYKKVFKY